MKNILTGSGLAAIVSTLALTSSAAASTGPANTLDGCAAGGPAGTTCTWTADVQGNWAVVGVQGSFTVSKQVCSINPATGAQVNSWSTIAQGTIAAPNTLGGAGTPLGSLQPGADGCGNPEVYQLMVTGEAGGVLGSVTGRPGAA